MKRSVFMMKTIILMLTAIGLIACSHCEKVKAQSQKQVKANPVKEGPHDSVIRGYCHHVPLIIDPDKVDDYLAEQSDTVNVYDVVEQMPQFPGGFRKCTNSLKRICNIPRN